MTEQNQAYLKDVMKSYFDEYGGILIDSYLREPSPANIAAAAKRAMGLDSRIKGNDIYKLRDFLDSKGEDIAFKHRTREDFIHELANYPDYKKISKFIYGYEKNQNTKTSMVNVEFLAWLIGFEPRPCSEHEKESKDKEIISFNSKNSNHHKQNTLAEQIFHNAGLIETFMNSALKDIMEAYNLNENEDFISLRNEVGDDVLLLNLSMAYLQQRARYLRRKKQNIDWIKKHFGAFGLFFVTVKQVNFSAEQLFYNVHQNLIGFGIEDFFDDFDESIHEV